VQHRQSNLSVPERSLHFGPRASITTPFRSKGLGFGLSCSCILKYASSRGRGNVVIPKGFPRSVGRVESRLLGFPFFPNSVISMACFGNAFHKITITAKARFGNRNHLSEMATIRPLPRSALVVHLPETDFNRARLAGYLRRCTYRSRTGNEKSLIEQLSGLGHFPGRELYKMPVIRTSGSKCRSFSAIPYPRPGTDFVRNPGFLAVRAA